MPRAIWSGSISFGLISLPVKAYSATSRQRIEFDLLHDADGSRIEYKRVSKATGKEVPWDHIVKGYELSPGKYVTFTKQELEELQPEATHTIDIEDFVHLEDIDPMFFDAPYHLLPEAGARRAYELLHRVMADAGVVAIARVVLRTRERLVSIRPLEGGTLAMETMHFANELREVPELKDDGKAKGKATVSDREVEMARSLVDELTTEFDPAQYHDTYREEVLERIEQKASGQTVETPEASEPAATPANDIMAALEASLAAARTKRSAKATTSRGGSGSAKRASSTKARSTSRSSATANAKAAGAAAAKPKPKAAAKAKAKSAAKPKATSKAKR